MLSKIKTKSNKLKKSKTNLNLENLKISKFIQTDKILIIASNTHLTKLCLDKYKNSVIYLIVYNNININEFVNLKNKYPNITLYFIGNNIDFTFYNTITTICNKIKFNTIIIDNDLSVNKYHNEFLIICGYLLCHNLLVSDGTYMHYMLCPDGKNQLLLKFLNILFDKFKNHNENEEYSYNNSKLRTLFIFNDLIKTDDKYHNLFINFLKNYYNEELNDENLDKLEYDLTKPFLLNIYNRWDNLNKIIEIKKGGELAFQRIRYGYESDLKKIPEIIDDLPDLVIPENIEYDDYEVQPRCYWGQKKLLMSEIQFLTRVAKTLKITNFKDYAVVYLGAAAGFHLPILYKMFPELIWLLYDPAPFSNVVHEHPKGKSYVSTYNMFFTDETLKHVKENCQNRKILFISDIRVDTEQTAVITDMRNQANWGIGLDADFMLLKFKLPYEDLEQIPKNNKDLNFDKKKLTNPSYTCKNKKSMVYLNGDVYLQLYPPPYSNELRLFVEKKKNKFKLGEYNYKNIRYKIDNYNNGTRIEFMCDEKICKDIPLKLLNLIPGFDTSIECLMEYKIFKDYYDYFTNITSNIKIINNIYDALSVLEKITKRKFYNCPLASMKYYRNRKDKYNIDVSNKINKLNLWDNIIKVKINLNIGAQIEYLKLYGKKVLGPYKYNNSIKDLTNNYNPKLLYYKL